MSPVEPKAPGMVITPSIASVLLLRNFTVLNPPLSVRSPEMVNKPLLVILIPVLDTIHVTAEEIVVFPVALLMKLP